MNLDKLTVNVKPLNPYQAMDLGLAVARAWYGELYKLWWDCFFANIWVFILFIVVYIGCVSYLGGGDVLYLVWHYYAIPIIWWLKPAYEYDMVIYLSQKLFDETYDVDMMVKTKEHMPKIGLKRMLFRYGFDRMISMPIYALEGQQGSSAKARLRTLTHKQGTAIRMHSLTFFVLEGVLFWVGIWLLAKLFGQDMDFAEQLSSSYMAGIVAFCIAAFYLLVVSLVAPFFVASGFMIYLCKRSLLEGWDIELTFRKLAWRYQHTKKSEQP